MVDETEKSPSSAFCMLEGRMQEQLYRMKWTQLRPIQVQAIHAIMGGDGHLIITANTAGGKTEAAFLPILSFLLNTPRAGVTALYVGPLKALINDQFRRIEELCGLTEIPVHRWHGDVGQSSKKSFLKDPSGVLLITPESIEALFVNHPRKLRRIFGGVSFVVIDELHSFIGTERGAHLKSLLSRIVAKSSNNVRLVCLSATLGDVELAKKWLFSKDDASVIHVEGTHAGKQILYRIYGYLYEKSTHSKRLDTEHPSQEEERFLEDIFQIFYGKTALIFANSRAFLEYCADNVIKKCEKDNLPDRFRIHHGSLSKSIREEAEEALKSNVPTATFCSSTLEMGIDVGRISEIGQIDPPWSVNSLVQRLGRSGRGDNDPSIMRHFVIERKPDHNAYLFDQIFPKLLQSIAMSELMLQGWCEPPDAGRLHLSTLVQQIMSVIYEYGGASAGRLYEILIVHGAFGNVSLSDYIDVLRSMGAFGLLEQAPEGLLILGETGERLVGNFDFYSAFTTSDEFRVVASGHVIGTVSANDHLECDQFLILAGHRWKIVEVYRDQKEILVERAPGGRVPSFNGCMGADIAADVRRKMREVLFSDLVPVYLDRKSVEILETARIAAANANLANHQFFSDGANTLWFTWTSSKVNRTLASFGRNCGRFKTIDDEGIGLVFHDVSAGDVVNAYLSIMKNPPDAVQLASSFPVKAVEKYEPYLSDDLLSKVVARNTLDVPATVCFLDQALAEYL